MQIMFSMYRQYQPNITGIEVYVEFKEIVDAKADYDDVPYSYAMSPHHNEVVPSSNSVSEPYYILLIFLFNDTYLLAFS